MRFLIALILVGCTIQPAPAPLPDGAGDCESSCANLERLGGCGLDLSHCAQDCRDRLAAEADLGLPDGLGCIANSPDCETALRCE